MARAMGSQCASVAAKPTGAADTKRKAGAGGGRDGEVSGAVAGRAGVTTIAEAAGAASVTEDLIMLVSFDWIGKASPPGSNSSDFTCLCFSRIIERPLPTMGIKCKPSATFGDAICDLSGPDMISEADIPDTLSPLRFLSEILISGFG